MMDAPQRARDYSIKAKKQTHGLCSCVAKRLLLVAAIIIFSMIALQYFVYMNTGYQSSYNQRPAHFSPAHFSPADPPVKNKSPTKKKKVVFKNWIMPFDEANKSSQNLPHLPPDALPYCPVIPPDLEGQLAVLTHGNVSYEDLAKKHSEVEIGGRWRPLDCTSRNKVAIIVPFRDREEHLLLFLQHMHPFLQKQQLDYGIYVAEMASPTKFNRAMMFNIGYEKASQDYDWQCYIFHDVDLLPEIDYNLYTCPLSIRHMGVAIDKRKYKLKYSTLVGGVTAVRKEHFEKLNGFSNMFFGWGAEGDDFYQRMKWHELELTRYHMNISRYKALPHVQSKIGHDRLKYYKTGKLRFSEDGINSLQYTLLKLEKRKLYTWIYVKVDKDKVRSTWKKP